MSKGAAGRSQESPMGKGAREMYRDRVACQDSQAILKVRTRKHYFVRSSPLAARHWWKFERSNVGPATQIGVAQHRHRPAPFRGTGAAFAVILAFCYVLLASDLLVVFYSLAICTLFRSDTLQRFDISSVASPIRL